MPDNVLLPGEILSMTASAADRLTASGSGDAALLYLHLLRRAGAYDPGSAARALRWDAPRLTAAHDTLVSLSLAVKQAASAPLAPVESSEEPPEYTAADITRELEDVTSSFPGLVNEVQRRLGKILSTADLKTLYTLYDFLALPAEVVCLLVSWCVEDMEQKYGPGHKPRMSQIRKEAFAWRRLGLDTAEAAEEHLKRQAVLRGRERDILPLVGVTGRAPVDGERKFIAAWVEMGFPDEAIRLAYEKTVFKKQTMSWPYMNSILRSWHQKGLHSVADIKVKDSDRPAFPAPVPQAAPAQDGRRVAEEVEWMKRFLANQKKEDG
ncbi:DnaD domain protein [uncultured Eubacteriales bacterium]|uniref:DnaD domain protein n=1 Tax=uncultured Eubacteriales bacterium TaxID=172733 RepID=A0A212KHY2_9FIRM|nr:DnaD domain protein [uncultured Eubacteriales bacterium]